ncbi:methyl-accepting chemotaxis protein [Novosphingobium sp. PhB55]|uniref:methyl-accepting chemotaxis protein n=1 Tax=unclassified Novosphingobium TaxID=2644732 RepID=UPI0010646B76|nr:methyl-accepting chemotaxis protein [Novosphingobium sp. PhB55]TDW59269.1 methyl-accepting chemotaxis protein [Novosphingobium sp. PhB55]TDW65265.1 methyl-accepting chemotaxis protein [Novosphingobium sp. PhB55]
MLEFLNNWRLPKKLWAAFSIINIMIAIVGINGFLSTRELKSVAEAHVSRGMAGMSGLTDVISNVKELRIIVYSYYNAASAADAQNLRDRLKSGDEDLLKSVEAYKVIGDEAFAAETADLRTRALALTQVNDRIFALRTAGDNDGAMALIKGDGKKASHDMIEQTDKLIELTRERVAAKAEDGAQTARTAMILCVTLALGAMALIVFIWLLINRSVAAPMSRIAQVTSTLAEGGKAEVPYRERGDEIGEIAEAVEQFRAAAESRAEVDAKGAREQELVTSTLRSSLQAISEGDLTQTINADFPPAYGELKSNFNSAVGALRDLIGAVAESAVAIRTGSSEIAQASEDLARRTESNAASLEETSAAITQMDERLRATAAAAGRTVQRADGAMNVVGSGREIADEAVQAMGRVSESAKGIDSVIEGLDKIAFQTRVLAMNAAVEAGRAGDAGRGFAVVADLVSALAMRSEEEAKRAREQLTATQTDIGTAVEAVQRVDGALQNISGDVTEVHSLLSDIASDNQAQSSTITEISATIGTMDQATQQNAAMVEETSAAARNLNSEVTSLSDRASMFRTGHEGMRAPVRTVAAASFAPAQPMQPAAIRKPMKALATADDWMDF